MHEKILIPPAVHDEPHFAKKTLVLAVLLSATSMFATAARNVVTGQTYLTMSMSKSRTPLRTPER
ncbi:MAG: hypothetical protein ACLUHG_01835 [Sutterella wadsworthensis]